MSEATFRLARLGEDAAIVDFINGHFDMRLPLLNRPELYRHYYAGLGGVPQFAANPGGAPANVAVAAARLVYPAE